MTILEAILLVLLFGSLVAQLERTHRRTRHLPRLTKVDRPGIPQWW